MSEAPPAGFSEIGSRLRSARMAAGMSAADAAERLHCDVQVIEALESGHFEQLGASVFVRGHLRRYGDLLGQRGDALVEQWAQIEPPRVAPDLTRVPQAPRPPDTTRLWQLAALAAGVAVFAIVTWWILQRPSRPAPGPDVVVAPTAMPSTPVVPAEEPLPAPAAQAERSPPPPAVPAPAIPPPAARVVPPKAAAVPVSAPSPVPTAAPLPASGSKAIAKPITTPIATPNSTTPAAAVARPIAATVAGATVAGAKPASVTTRPAPVVVAPAPAAAVAKPAKAPAATTGAAATAGPAATTAQSTRPAPAANAPARLRISISQDCWVEVYDATDKRLYVDLAPAGKRIEVTGAAPLRVRLGREGVAQLQVNDRAVTPPTAARRGQTALFTVTAEGATELVKRD